MKETESEVDSLDSDITIALFALAGDVHVIQRKMLQLLEGPWCEHQPGDNRVEEKYDSVGDASSHAIEVNIGSGSWLEDCLPRLEDSTCRAYR